MRRVAEQDRRVVLDPVDGRHCHAHDDRLLAADRRVEGLDPDRHAADVDRRDVLVVAELLAAGRALFLGVLDEALLQRHGVTVDAAELLVGHLDGQIGAVGRGRADLLLPALLVEPPDVDRGLVGVGLAGLATHVLDVVGDGLLPRAARLIVAGVGGGVAAAPARLRRVFVVVAASGCEQNETSDRHYQEPSPTDVRHPLSYPSAWVGVYPHRSLSWQQSFERFVRRPLNGTGFAGAPATWPGHEYEITLGRRRRLPPAAGGDPARRSVAQPAARGGRHEQRVRDAARGRAHGAGPAGARGADRARAASRRPRPAGDRARGRRDPGSAGSTRGPGVKPGRARTSRRPAPPSCAPCSSASRRRWPIRT